VHLANWGTPQARDHFPAHSDEYVAAKKAQGHGMQNLNDQAQLAAWATPTRRDYRFANRLSFKERGGGHEGRAVEQPSGAPVAGFWADAEWIECRDGKARPIEPSPVALVDGLSEGMGQVRAVGDAEESTFPLAPRRPNHVGRLRGYGNAIVPEVAEEVIRAFMECAP
jgi:DNA (cytosine-5)-methyltransferase 1